MSGCTGLGKSDPRYAPISGLMSSDARNNMLGGEHPTWLYPIKATDTKNVYNVMCSVMIVKSARKQR